MKFNIDDYKGRYVMHCKTEEEARDFVDYMRSIDRPITNSLWCLWGDNVSFFNNGTWSSKYYAKEKGYTILEWSDFMNKKFTKADLKTGDVVMQRNGLVQIVNCEHQMFITRDGWNDMNQVNPNLTNKAYEEFDIVAVRRPLKKSDCQFNAFRDKMGTLVYERKEVEEMTLAEVCRLLGKEIKIVK